MESERSAAAIAEVPANCEAPNRVVGSPVTDGEDQFEPQIIKTAVHMIRRIVNNVVTNEWDSILRDRIEKDLPKLMGDKLSPESLRRLVDTIESSNVRTIGPGTNKSRAATAPSTTETASVHDAHNVSLLASALGLSPDKVLRLRRPTLKLKYRRRILRRTNHGMTTRLMRRKRAAQTANRAAALAAAAANGEDIKVTNARLEALELAEVAAHHGINRPVNVLTCNDGSMVVVSDGCQEERASENDDPLAIAFHMLRQCGICATKRFEYEFAYSATCSHVICKECLGKTPTPERCPFCRADVTFYTHLTLSGERYHVAKYLEPVKSVGLRILELSRHRLNVAGEQLRQIEQQILDMRVLLQRMRRNNVAHLQLTERPHRIDQARVTQNIERLEQQHREQARYVDELSRSMARQYDQWDESQRHRAPQSTRN